MPKRKHTVKHQVIPCADANQRSQERIKERARIAEARRKKLEEMRAKYFEEKRKEEADKKGKEIPTIQPPTITPQEG